MRGSIHPEDVFVQVQPRSQVAYFRAHRHASQRLTERYGLTMPLREYIALCQELQALPFGQLPKASHRTQRAGRVLLNLRIDGVQTRAIWSTRDGVIVTWLPSTPSTVNNIDQIERRWQEQQRKRYEKVYCRHTKHRGAL